MAHDYARRKFATLKSHQHSAASERVDKCRGIANRKQTPGRTGALSPEAFPRCAQPLRFGLCISERVCSSPVLHQQLAHHNVWVRMVALHLRRGDNEAKIADLIFDGAEPSITLRIEIDLTSPWSDTRI